MILYKKRSYLHSLLFLGLLLYGCGEKQQAEVAIENFDTPPQVTITLHSQLALDFPLDPAPQLSTDDTLGTGEAGGAKVNAAYAAFKRKRGNQSQSGALPDFKANHEYQSLKRYENIDSERYIIKFEKSPDRSSDGIRETVKLQDKPLVFAGRGYNINAFEKEMIPAIDVDYATHLVATLPEPQAEEAEDLMDLKAGYSRDTKFLVYNSTRSAFGKKLPPLIDSKPEQKRSMKLAAPLEKNQDSILVFPSGKESIVVLRKAEQQFDLLRGNEMLNKKQFKASSVKVPETSNKTPSTR